MRKILISIAALTIAAFSGISMSFAQDDGPPNFVPVEMQACNYADGNDPGDFVGRHGRYGEVDGGQ